jgi:hypothetical protein
MKVLELKLSADSSDEERLVAGISTIGLQNKRLSGAQRRRLTRIRKMKEGTWKDEEPLGKTPLSCAKEVSECSGGVIRPHTDLSTPSQDKQQTKKPRITQVQTVAYKEAVVGIEMAIIHRHHPEVKLDNSQYDII